MRAAASRRLLLEPPAIKGNVSDRRLRLFASEQCSVVWIETWPRSASFSIAACRAAIRYVTSSREVASRPSDRGSEATCGVTQDEPRIRDKNDRFKKFEDLREADTLTSNR
jgi:hypothetical protein